jgi:hypothetical protein
MVAVSLIDGDDILSMAASGTVSLRSLRLHRTARALSCQGFAALINGRDGVIFHRGVYVSFRSEPVVGSTVYGRIVPDLSLCQHT